MIARVFLDILLKIGYNHKELVFVSFRRRTVVTETPFWKTASGNESEMR